MSSISQKIKDYFPNWAVMKDSANDSLFAGRNLPSFVKDYIIKKFSDKEGKVNRENVINYLKETMPDDIEALTSRLMAIKDNEERNTIDVTVRFVIKSNPDKGIVEFIIPDAGTKTNGIVNPELIEKFSDELVDGERWGRITLMYVEPQGKEKGYIQMKGYKSFKPYKVLDVSDYLYARQQMSITEWMDVLIAAMEYDPDAFDTIEQKMEFITRLLILVEPRLNTIELGPKGTGKSYVYNNISKHVWLLSGGKTSRAKMFYNKSTKQFGIVKSHDAVILDEISSFGFSDPDEMQSILKGYLEAGKASVDNVQFTSECGIGLTGNIKLTSEMLPFDSNYFKKLPDMFQESATIDRFHSFLEGWKLPRLEVGSILEGWTLNAEYFSEVLHHLRTESDYQMIFDDLVETDDSCDLRDRNAVKKVATAYAKLLFPQVKSLEDLTPEDADAYRLLYKEYCLEPAVYRRGIIREQCHLIDKEFRKEMPEFKLKPSTTKQEPEDIQQ